MTKETKQNTLNLYGKCLQNIETQRNQIKDALKNLDMEEFELKRMMEDLENTDID